MVVSGVAVSARDALRAYIVGLRKARNISQDELADAIGMGRRTYLEYEQGRTKDIKSDPLMRAIRYLRGSFAHVQRLASATATPDLGASLAALRVEEERTIGEIKALQDTLTDEEIQEIIRNEVDRLQGEINHLRGLRQQPDS